MLSSEQVKKIKAEAAPYIRRQMEDAKVIASFRDMVSNAGGDWGALKAVIKAEIQDEEDEGGNKKKIGKLANKAEQTRIFLDMLGLGPNLNEKNSFAEEPSDNPAFEKWLEEVAGQVDPRLLLQLIEGSKTAAGRAIIMAAIQVVKGEKAADAETCVIIETPEPAPSPSGDVAAASEGDVRPVATGSLSGEGGADAPALSANQSTAARKDVQSGPDAHRHARLSLKSEPAGTQAPPVDTPSTPDKSAASGLAAAPVTFLRPHDGPLSSKGLARHKDCLDLELCTGKWNEPCRKCRVAAEQRKGVVAGGVEIEHRGSVN